MKRFWRRYKKLLLVIGLIIDLIWYSNCIPKILFDDPYSLVLIDTDGELLGAHVSKDEQWRFPETKKVNEKFSKALIAYEDKRFYKHIGVDAFAMARAMRLNIQQGRIVSGGSTLSMQVIRLSRKNPKRSVFEKLTEVVRATRLELRYSKKEILNLYASHAPFGGNVVGIDAASWKYFGKCQDKLSWSEAAMLAVLPNSPSLIHPGRNRERLKEKRDWVLDKLLENQTIDSITCVLSKWEPLPQKPHPLPDYCSHLLSYLLKQDKQNYIHTNIDIDLQRETASLLQRELMNLETMAVHNAAALIVELKTGNVVSYVGNVENKKENFENRVDMIRSKRSSGSILKPFLYAEMLDEGQILPHSLVQDIPVDFNGYNPKNYNLTFNGVVPAHEMVSKSLNIPAVNLLNAYGVNKFASVLNAYGLSTINHSGNHYGLPLILGGAEVTPWELAKVYAAMCQKLNGDEVGISVINNGVKKQIRASNYPDKAAIWYMLEAMLEVSRPNENKSWRVFSSNHKVAWKTGTSYGGRDAWAVGCNPKYVVVVWAGNSDGEGRPSLTGYNSAAPILFNIFNYLPKSEHWFNPNENRTTKIDLCMKSGFKANNHCAKVKIGEVPERGENSKPCSYCKSVMLDANGEFCVNGSYYAPLDRVTKPYFILSPVEEKYYQKHHADYVKLPFSNSKKASINIVYPKNEARIYLPKLDKKTSSNFTIKAKSDKKEDRLHWTLDGNYCGVTVLEHTYSLKPKKGKHTLVVVNEAGDRKSIVFEVL